MELCLAENIRAFRRERGMTQEQLAEALCVTAGAVYKWENGRSTPEVGLLADMADLFGISMDALLGYEMRGGGQEQVIARLWDCTRDRNTPHAVAEAEKALKKYPNTFAIVYRGAVLYGVKGMDEHNERYTRRALSLYKHALCLIGQNTDPAISTLSIQCHIADIYAQLNEGEKAVELLKQNNPCNINSARIGEMLASLCNRPKEAILYLSDGILEYFMLQTELVMGYLNVFVKQKEYTQALEILSWWMESNRGLKIPGKISFLDKTHAVYLLLCGEVHLRLGHKEQAWELMRQARDTAEAFDADPSYACCHIRFVAADEKATTHDTWGATAMQALQNHVDEENDPAFTALWEEVVYGGR